MKHNYLNIVGLAYRARKCTTGEETIVQHIRENKVKLLLLASDVSNQTKKKYTDKCKTFKVPYIEVDDRKTLGNAIGKSERVAIAILEDGFAKKLQTLLQ